MREIYIPGTKVIELSAALWGLVRPPSVRRPNEGTEFLFGRIKEQNGQECLVVWDGHAIRVHAEAELGRIAGILQPLIDEGVLPAETNAQLAGYVNAMRGQMLVVYEAFPALFKLKDARNPDGLGRTREQMIEEGRLRGPTLS